MNATRSQVISTSLSICEFRKTAVPRWRRSWMISRTRRRPTGSSPEVGSSRMTSSGSFSSACARPMRCSMPFENWRSFCSACCARPTSSSSSGMRCRESGVGMWYRSACSLRNSPQSASRGSESARARSLPAGARLDRPAARRAGGLLRQWERPARAAFLRRWSCRRRWDRGIRIPRRARRSG